ncbi:MAG: polysaccharide deacetylase family protein [Alcaligenaceae bacterium]|nr:polysaccharide deacetylase family protein [Alcaligenaceae bacterium]
MYHQIGLTPPRHSSYRGLTVHPKSFARQMWAMHQLGYRGLSMRDLLPYLKREKVGKVFGITFDDGFRNVFQNALPVMLKYNFTSTNYLVANLFSQTNLWDKDKGVPRAELMSLAEMREWAQAGQEIGSHTLDHVHLLELSLAQAREQLVGSRQKLVEALGADVTAFCYPYGDFNVALQQLAQEAGYTSATTTERGLARMADDMFAIPRVGIWRSTPLLRFLYQCLSQHENRRRA